MLIVFAIVKIRIQEEIKRQAGQKRLAASMGLLPKNQQLEAEDETTMIDEEAEEENRLVLARLRILQARLLKTLSIFTAY